MLISLVILFASPITGAGQDVPMLEVGQRVRMTAAAHDLTRAVATIQALTNGVIVVEPLGAETVLRIPRSDVTALDVSVARRSRSGTGAAIGMVTGAVVGLGIALGLEDDPPNQLIGPSFSAGEKGVIVVLGV
ncbi:MAG: hypothetical protein OEO79_18945, partial [Gemmatimonadota bacterium]|nr:hypothetical protein [Gemmatimonadota bacterium]